MQHERQKLDGLYEGQGWTTTFRRFVQDGQNTEGKSNTEDNSSTEDEIANTDFPRFNIVARKESHRKVMFDSVYKPCDYCSRRFFHQFINSLDQLATVFVDSTDMCYVEFAFVDPVDGASEWRYRFFHSGAPACIE